MIEILIPAIVLFLTPILTDWVKKTNKYLNANVSSWRKKLPKWSIPLVAILIASLLPLIGQMASAYESNALLNLLLGTGAVGLREVVVNFKKNWSEKKLTVHNKGENL